ncbi:MAG TPA: SGNH hydrolase domain-containing protein [Solirubrobacteraceae bacterium]|nr:SGNH hydrolase domain-containing protein [Solirubrobacteraceae bacterium]
MAVVITMAAALPLSAASGAPDEADACFGAAARAHPHACERWTSSRTATPDPRVADSLPGAPCDIIERRDVLSVCAFGREPSDAVATVALVGDSHAAHWRGALEVVAQAHGWRALSMMRSSCPLSKAVRDLDEPKFTLCRDWKELVFQWFREHPEIETVFVSGLTGGSGVVPARGRSRFRTAVAGFRRAWEALPPTVERIIVIRDTPKTRPDVTQCVERAIERGTLPNRACSTTRRDSLDVDAAMVAARKWPSPRVQSVDLTHYFCGRRRCYPVSGGVLVLRDQHHMTATYSTTLGPMLLRKSAPLLVR